MNREQSRVSSNVRIIARLTAIALGALGCSALVRADEPPGATGGGAAATADRAAAAELAATAAPAATAATDAEPVTEPTRRERRRARARNEDRAPQPITPSPLERTALAPSADSLDPSGESTVVCRYIKPTGSRMERRVCATAEQWETARAAGQKRAQEGMRQMRERAALANPSSGQSNPPPPR